MRPATPLRYATRRIGDAWCVVDTQTPRVLRTFQRLADAARCALTLNAADELGNFKASYL